MNESSPLNAMRIKLSSIASFPYRSEAGQTSTEYVAMTAVALLTAILLTWTALSGALNTAMDSMFDRLTDFMANPPGF